MVRTAMSASFDYQLNPTTTLSFGAGAGTGGSLTAQGSHYGIAPGWLATASYARRLVDGSGSLPFVILGLSFGASGASARRAAPREGSRGSSMPSISGAGSPWGRPSFRCSVPTWRRCLFGGPVLWRLDGDIALGTDVNHYQLAAGLVTALPRGVDVFVEGAPLGERSVSLGGGFRF